MPTIASLKQELADRRYLARHARQRGLRAAERFHVELALAARAALRRR